MSLTFSRSILFLFLLLPMALQAQEYKFEAGGWIGGAFYMGDVNKTTPFKGLNPTVGGVFRYNANLRIAFKGDFAWARVTGSTDGLDNVFPNNAQGSFERNLFDLGGQFEFNFFPYSDIYPYLNTNRISPYVLIGYGATVAPGNGETMISMHIPIGIGIKYKVKNRLNLVGEFSMRKLFSDGLDVTNGSNKFLDNPYGIGGGMLKNNDWYGFFTVSLTWDFGLKDCKCNNSNGLF